MGKSEPAMRVEVVEMQGASATKLHLKKRDQVKMSMGGTMGAVIRDPQPQPPEAGLAGMLK